MKERPASGSRAAWPSLPTSSPCSGYLCTNTNREDTEKWEVSTTIIWFGLFAGWGLATGIGPVASMALGPCLHGDLQRTPCGVGHPGSRGIAAHARRRHLWREAHDLQDCHYTSVYYPDCSWALVAGFLHSERLEGIFSSGSVDPRIAFERITCPYFQTSLLPDFVDCLRTRP